jgi:hypothetical protein
MEQCGYHFTCFSSPHHGLAVSAPIVLLRMDIDCDALNLSALSPIEDHSDEKEFRTVRSSGRDRWQDGRIVFPGFRRARYCIASLENRFPIVRSESKSQRAAANFGKQI